MLVYKLLSFLASCVTYMKIT